MKRDWLVKTRKVKKKTQQEIADSIKISRAYYTRIENGIRKPSVEVAILLGNYLDFDWTLFFKDIQEGEFKEELKNKKKYFKRKEKNNDRRQRINNYKIYKARVQR